MTHKTDSAGLVNIEAQLVRLLYHNSPTGVIVNAAIAVLLAWVLWGRVPHNNLEAWVAAVLLVNGLRFYNYWSFRQSKPGDDAVAPWRLYFMIGALLSAAVWGISPWWLGPFSDPVTPMILAFVLGGLMAGAAAILGGVLKIYICYALIIMGPITVWFATQSNSTEISLGVMLLVAMLALMSNGLVYRRVLRGSIQLSNAWYLAKEEAEEASRAKARFLSRMSHELRTPLSAILGYAQLLQEHQVRGTQGRSYVDQIVDASDHLLALINDLLDLSRIESRTVTLQIKALNCRQILGRCMDKIQSLAHANRVLLYPLDWEDDVGVLADEQRIQQILLNLLSNICGCNLPGGRIGVGLYSLSNEKVRLYVDDLSQSIPDVLHDQMFLSYHRLGREESAVEGTGLGLMISQQLIELMGGSLGVIHKANEPARFYIDLPRAPSINRSNAVKLSGLMHEQPYAGV